MPQRLRIGCSSEFGTADYFLAEHADLPGVGGLQADDRAQKHRLAGAGATDHAENLAAADVEAEVLVDDLLAERIAEVPDRDDDLRLRIGMRILMDMMVVGGAHIQPISVKKTAKKASRTMTRKIA